MGKDLSKKKDDIQNKVVSGGYCIGCGACAAKSDRYKMIMNEHGMYEANLVNPNAAGAKAAFGVCPFGESSLNEDDIARDVFGNDLSYHDGLGHFRDAYAGFVLDPGFRAAGSSGGFGSWLLVELFKNEMIDAVIHVRSLDKAASDDSSKPLFAYSISNNEESIRSAAKSRYYPIELSEVIELVRKTNKRYAVTALPCFVKALRLLCRGDRELESKLKFFIGLVCGHLKSTGFAEFMAWQVGVNPSELKSLDFRYKLPHREANQYGLKVESRKNSRAFVRQMDSLFGHTWSLGLFRNPACDFCDDVFAETADITVGDAWLPEYVGDPLGTNVIIVRNSKLGELITNAEHQGRVSLNRLSAKAACDSQQAGLRHRRRGLAHRLYLRRGEWTPKKRVEASKEKDGRYRRIFELRHEITFASHEWFLLAKKNNLLDECISPLRDLSDMYYLSYGRFSRKWIHLVPRQVARHLVRIKRSINNLRGILNH